MEWAAFERVEGPLLLHDRVDVAGAIAGMYAAIPHMKQGSEPRLLDFMPPWYDREPPRQSPEEIMDAIKRLAKRKPHE
jgi:hypothetical protein